MSETTGHVRSRHEEKIFRGVFRLHAKVMGLVMGILSGLAVFLMTNWILIMGGHTTPDGVRVLGPHLQVLGQIFIGYSVSFPGSIIGFVYGFAVGSISGSIISWIYNKFVEFRN